MKNLAKLSIILTITVLIFNRNNALAGPPTFVTAYIAFSISEGIEVSDGPMDGKPGVRMSIAGGDLFFDISSSDEISTVAFSTEALFYRNATGYQNAQCIVDGTPRASTERFAVSTNQSAPTQIVCTAEKIPDEPEEPDEPDAPEGQNSSVDFNLNISEMLEITGLPSTINLDIDSSNFDKLATTTLNLSTASNYAYGYIFTLLTDSTNLTDSTTSATIPTLASGTYTDANFTTNRWGFSLDSTNFRPIATTNTLYSTTAPSISTPTTITLGLKLDATQPAGTYSTVLNFALTPNIVTE